jgi:hypothetical protein
LSKQGDEENGGYQLSTQRFFQGIAGRTSLKSDGKTIFLLESEEMI